MPDRDLPERVGSLETSVRGLNEDVSDLKRSVSHGFSEVQATLTRGRETNWPVIFSALMLIGALYASAVKPLQSDIERHQKQSDVLADAVLVKEEKISNLRVDVVKLNSEVSVLQSVQREIIRNGSPSIDRRLSILEAKVSGSVK